MGDVDLGGSYFGDRWSLALARPPGWLMRESPAVIDWYRVNVFNRADVDDPNALLARMEQQFINEAASRGLRADATSANNLQTIGELNVGETSWAEIASAQRATGPAEVTQAIFDAGREARAAAFAQPVAEQIAASIARTGPTLAPAPAPSAAMPGQQDAYGTVTTAGLEGSTQAPNPAQSGPAGGSSLPGGYRNAPANQGGASGFTPIPSSSSSSLSAALGGVSPYTIAAGVVLLFLLLNKRKGS